MELVRNALPLTLANELLQVRFWLPCASRCFGAVKISWHRFELLLWP